MGKIYYKNKAASGDEPEAANFLIFFIKFGLITVASDQDVRHPGGRLPHDGSDAADIDFFQAFDDKLVMDMATDLLIGKILHSVAQQISGYSLYNIFYEFRTVGFYAFPFLGGADAFVGDGFTAESVFINLWLHIAEYSAGRELD